MSRLRSDIDIMPDNELESWINNILSGTHIADIKTLNNILTNELKIYSIEKLAKKDFKVCDKCGSTYPIHTNICSYCSNHKLRVFKVVIGDLLK